jgi:hypothetical protein
MSFSALLIQNNQNSKLGCIMVNKDIWTISAFNVVKFGGVCKVSQNSWVCPFTHVAHLIFVFVVTCSLINGRGRRVFMNI